MFSFPAFILGLCFRFLDPIGNKLSYVVKLNGFVPGNVSFGVRMFHLEWLCRRFM